MGKVNFDPIANFVQTKEILILGQVLNIQIDYFDVLPKLSRHAKWKHLKHKFTFNNDFMMNMELQVYLNFSILVWSVMTLGMYLSAGGWFYL